MSDRIPRLALELAEMLRPRVARLTQLLALSVAGELEEVADRSGAERAVGVLLVIGRYVAHAAFVNALEIRPPVPSIFEDGFEP